MTPHLIIGATRLGRPFSVNIFARSEEDARKQFRFRYSAIGCFSVEDRCAENAKAEKAEAQPGLPVLNIRKRSRK